MPIFKNFQLLKENTDLELYIKKIGEKHFELWNAKENKLIGSFTASTEGELDTLKNIIVQILLIQLRSKHQVKNKMKLM